MRVGRRWSTSSVLSIDAQAFPGSARAAARWSSREPRRLPSHRHSLLPPFPPRREPTLRSRRSALSVGSASRISFPNPPNMMQCQHPDEATSGGDQAKERLPVHGVHGHNVAEAAVRQFLTSSRSRVGRDVDEPVVVYPFEPRLDVVPGSC